MKNNRNARSWLGGVGWDTARSALEEKYHQETSDLSEIKKKKKEHETHERKKSFFYVNCPSETDLQLGTVCYSCFLFLLQTHKNPMSTSQCDASFPFLNHACKHLLTFINWPRPRDILEGPHEFVCADLELLIGQTISDISFFHPYKRTRIWQVCLFVLHLTAEKSI